MPNGKNCAFVVGKRNFYLDFGTERFRGIIGCVFPFVAGIKRKKSFSALDFICAERAGFGNTIIRILLTYYTDTVFKVRTTLYFLGIITMS